MNDRDELLRQAVRVYNQLALVREQAERAPLYERAAYAARAAELGAELRALLDQHERRPV
jgi:hypothetical protein